MRLNPPLLKPLSSQTPLMWPPFSLGNLWRAPVSIAVLLCITHVRVNGSVGVMNELMVCWQSYYSGSVAAL